MTPDWNTVRTELLNLSPQNALEKILVLQGEARTRLETETAFIRKLDEAHDRYASVLSLADMDDPSASTPADVPASREDVIIEALEKAGRPVTFKELYTLIPQLSWSAIYRLVQGAEDSMIKRGRVLFQGSRPGTLSVNADWQGEQPLDRYIDDLVERDPTVTRDDPVVRRFAEALRVYTEQVIWVRNEGRRLRANHTLKAVKNRGVIGAISVMVAGSETSGFEGLNGLGRPELTAEQIVCDFPERFEPSVVEAAQRRLTER